MPGTLYPPRRALIQAALLGAASLATGAAAGLPAPAAPESIFTRDHPGTTDPAVAAVFVEK